MICLQMTKTANHQTRLPHRRNRKALRPPLWNGTVVAIDFEVVDFLAALAADVGELLLTLDAEVAAACEVGGDARGRGTGEGVEHPGVLVGRGEDDAGEQGEGLLRGVLAAGLFPLRDGGQRPQVSHLRAAVDGFHQLVVVIMGNFFAFSRPQDELGRMGEKAAGKIRRRIRLCPRNAV